MILTGVAICTNSGITLPVLTVLDVYQFPLLPRGQVQLSCPRGKPLKADAQ